MKKDKNPEPTGQLVKAMLLGVATCIPAALIEMAISWIFFGDSEGGSSLIGNIFDAFFVAAIPEECLKLLALWLVLRKNPYFNEHFDGIVYSVCVGLGFATAENVLYLFDNMSDWASVAIGRAIFSVPGHYAFAVLMGYYYARYSFVESSTKNLICILAVPVLAHGIYDAIVMNIGINEYLILPIFALLIFFCVMMHKKCKKKILAQLQMDGTA
ncbi:MAG: PrsW family intramembrane metalloprotease [Bacteroidaceae bacterium]|nr:PrsW family intramembrane metalloprotease [Bacteroidaceae bacterium]